MAFDRPRMYGGRSGELNDELRLRCRVRVLTLAGDLDDVGVRSRVVEWFGRPVMLRCWNPDQQGKTVVIACGPDGAGRLAFRYHPSGEMLGDAEEALEPGDSVDVARRVAARLPGDVTL